MQQRLKVTKKVLSNELLNENEYLVIRRHVYAHLKLYVHTFTGL